MALRYSVGVLRERDFRLLFTGQTLSNLGSALVPVALAFAVLDLTGSATDLGLVLLASRLPNLVLVLTGGVVADRFSRRWVMLASDAIRCLTQAATAVLLVTGTARLWELLALQAAHGAAAAFFGIGATLWVGAVWVIASTAALLTVRGIRTLPRRDAPETPAPSAPWVAGPQAT